MDSRDNSENIRERIAAVVNPCSAHGRTAKCWKKYEDALRKSCGDCKVFFTKRPGHGTDLTRQALHDGYSRILSIGGDGTHYEVVNGFFDDGVAINPDARLAIIPAGTGSDLARTVSMPKGAAAIPSAVTGPCCNSDVGLVSYTRHDGSPASAYFINIADFGAGGETVRRSNENSKRFGGFISFLFAAVSTIITYKPREMRLKIDEKEIEGRFQNIIVANGRYYGGGMHVAPDARLDSNVFDVYMIGDIGPMEAIANLPKLYRGKLKERPDIVTYCQAKTISADSDEEVLINLDGEQPGRLPLEIRIIPSAIKIVSL